MYAARLISAILAGLLLAACGGDGGTPDETPDQGASGAEVVAGDLFFEPETLSAAAGEVTIALDNQGSAVHNVVIEEAEDTKVVEAEGGASATGTITLDAGTYTFYCDITGHREAGMEGTLTVGG